MSHVFVLDPNKHPLNPVHPGRARLLLSAGKAAVYRRYPFVIILKQAVEEPEVHPLRVKFDPGSKTTGIAVVNDASGQVVFAAELQHRGAKIKEALDDRRGVRQSRRRRHTRCRPPRFENRTRRKGWLPPSIESRIANTLTWAQRLQRYCPVGAISQEVVKFDTQAMQHPDVSGVAYQQGELMGYEVRAYLLEKWGRRCSYCSKGGVPLQVEHIVPRVKGGTDRVSNLCLACEPCNTAKGIQDIAVFLQKKPDVLTRILAQVTVPLKDAAAVNVARWEMYYRLQHLGVPVEVGTGGRTQYNRTMRHLPKSHWHDAACVGASTPEHLTVKGVSPLLIEATGYGNRQMCGVNDAGFPIRHRQRKKVHHGYQTGDLVRAVVPKGTHIGTHEGRVLARATGSFDLRTAHRRIGGVPARYCRPIQRNDGYRYHTTRGGNSSPD